MRRWHDMPFGARLTDAGTEFRLWAPAARKVDLRLTGKDGRIVPMPALPGGWFAVEVPQNLTGSHYVYLIDGSDGVPDPASRFQPDGPSQPSLIVDPRAYEWSDGDWHGRPWIDAVLYELHIGTFTAEGTFRAAISKLDHLAALGVTALEIMPVAEFPGIHNWGYDGVDLFAIAHIYGGPDDFKALIDAAHARGLMIVLDVVWNHFGPEGNYLGRYAPEFFTQAHHTPWGGAINFDQAHSDIVRDFYRHNALYWLEEFNIDGLRLDAIHAIKDDSKPTILEEIAAAVRERAGDRYFHLIAENEMNQARLLARDPAGHPVQFTAQWNDDFHHPLHVLATGESDAYYVDYADDPIDLLGRALAEGFAYQGEASKLRKGAKRGETSGFLPPDAFIPFLQNHDQVGNRPFGERLVSHANPEALRAAVAILLLSPQIPLLFMGEEWGTRSPFPYFCDMSSQLGEIIRKSRAAEFAIGERFADRTLIDRIPDPLSLDTFNSAKLDWSAIGEPDHARWLDLYRSLLALRHRMIVPLLPLIPGHAGRYAVTQGTLLHVDWRIDDGRTLSLLANLGPDPRDTASASAAAVLYASHAAGNRAEPWSVRWTLSA